MPWVSRADAELRALVRELRDKDASAVEIAEVLNVTRQAVYYMLRR
jgi:predicted DNA-binding protein YlxM (UPF0122 family)